MESAKGKIRRAYDTLDISLLKEAISEGADVNVCGKYDDTLFNEMIERYLGYGVNKDDKAAQLVIEFTSLLFENGLNLNATDKGGWNRTFIIAANYCDSDELLEFLLKSGCNPNLGICIKDGRTPYDELIEDAYLDKDLGFTDMYEYKMRHAEIARRYGALGIKDLRKQHHHLSQEEKKKRKAEKRKAWLESHGKKS